jgi:hypothetical protein
LQWLLKIGERSIPAALQVGNTASAKRMLLTLMQSYTGRANSTVQIPNLEDLS